MDSGPSAFLGRSGPHWTPYVALSRFQSLGFSHMLVSYMQVLAGDEPLALDPQRDSLLAVSVDERHRRRAPARDGLEN
jgi:hypothetical protein